MNDIERIEKTLHDVIDYLVLTSGEVDKIGALKDIRRNLIDEPAQPEGYQGLNKWYKTSGGHIIYAVSINEFNCYGLRVKNEINKKDHWCNDFALQLNIIECLATESEIKEAILKGCEQHGIVEGATVKIDDSFLKFEIENFNDVYYHVKHNRLFINDIKVFDNGKFAEVVKKEKECKPTDKELLKECHNYLNDIRMQNYIFKQIKSKFNSFRFYADNVPEVKIKEIENKLKEIYDGK